MMKSNVVVKEVPSQFVAGDAWSFFEETRPIFKSRRPTVVFDFSRVAAIDRSGVLVLVKCFEEALKQNGDVKLASVPAELAYTLQQTGLDQICDVYDTAQEASDSFYADGWADEIYLGNFASGAIHSGGD